MFGGDRDADAFASTKGNLPPPVAGKVVANYGQQHKSGATYRGVILRAGHNAPIKAVASGKVSFAGNLPGLGNTVIVSHGGRYHTVYARLGTMNVKEGESIGRGTSIGALPDDNADMHFELRDQGKAVDPGPWLKGGVPGAAP
jgi:septal ring factor EnvC (AmiA/AmiB activator)